MKTHSICPWPQVRASVVCIDRERALALLGANTTNQRKIVLRNLRRIEACLRENRFELNGESLIIGESGRVLDGQHRLLGCINTRIPFWTVLVEGVDDGVFASIDTGESRRLTSVLQMRGYKNSSYLAATVIRLAEHMKNPLQLASGSVLVTVPEAMMVLEMCDGLPEAVNTCRAWAKLRAVAGTNWVAWLYWLTHDEAPAEAKEFFAQLAGGEMLAAESPVYLLRARLIAERMAATKAKLPTREVLAIIILAWNAHLQGKTLKMLRWSSGRNEKFPLVQLKPALPPPAQPAA